MVSKSEFVQSTAAQLLCARASSSVSLSTMVNGSDEGFVWTMAVKVAEQLAAELERKGHAFQS
jgi:hypothetical protein